MLAVADVEDAGAARPALPLVARDRPEIDAAFIEARLYHAPVMRAVRHRDRAGLLCQRRDAPLRQPLPVGPQRARKKYCARDAGTDALAHRFDDLVGCGGSLHRHAPLHNFDAEARRQPQHRRHAGGMLHWRDEDFIAALPFDAHQDQRERIGGVARNGDFIDAGAVAAGDSCARVSGRFEMDGKRVARGFVQPLLVTLAHAVGLRALLPGHQVDDFGIERELPREIAEKRRLAREEYSLFGAHSRGAMERFFC